MCAHWQTIVWHRKLLTILVICFVSLVLWEHVERKYFPWSKVLNQSKNYISWTKWTEISLLRFVLLYCFDLLLQLFDHLFLLCNYAFHSDQLLFRFFQSWLHLFKSVCNRIFLKCKRLINIGHRLGLEFHFVREILKDNEKIFTIRSWNSFQTFCNLAVSYDGLKFLKIRFLLVQQWEPIPIEFGCHVKKPIFWWLFNPE